MFGIGGGEFVFIALVALMLFGSDKIPELARSLGKGMAQLKNATNEIKGEINKSVKENGMDINTLTGGISQEINKAKAEMTEAVNINPLDDIQNPIQEIKEDIENAVGPVKRQNRR